MYIISVLTSINRRIFPLEWKMKPILLFVVTFLVTYAQFCGSAQASDATDAKSRDLKRITDVNSTYTALEMYYLDNVRYPSTLKDIEQVGYYFRVTPNDPTA